MSRVVVTGAASGMGRAIAVAFAQSGAQVVAADIDGDGGQETAAIIARAGGTARFCETDVTDTAAVAAMVAFAVASFGGLDVAVNAAGIRSEGCELIDCPDDVFDRLLDVNLRSVFLCVKHEVRQMVTQGQGGSIVNIASGNALRAIPQHSAYGASKHGVVGLTANAALEYAPHGIRINAICPGPTDTPMLAHGMARRSPAERAAFLERIPARRVGTAEEIADAALWLCSDAARQIVGHALPMDGGLGL